MLLRRHDQLSGLGAQECLAVAGVWALYLPGEGVGQTQSAGTATLGRSMGLVGELNGVVTGACSSRPPAAVLRPARPAAPHSPPGAAPRRRVGSGRGSPSPG